MSYRPLFPSAAESREQTADSRLSPKAAAVAIAIAVSRNRRPEWLEKMRYNDEMSEKSRY
ncbi:MAG: hypothetical protein LBG27_08310 [Spirochaetaceae bacterium]|nr:hypothetical protein [Spirochaetaceae bacterium]